jgi:hypothetical protein
VSNASPFITWDFSVLAKAEGKPRDLRKTADQKSLTKVCLAKTKHVI